MKNQRISSSHDLDNHAQRKRIIHDGGVRSDGGFAKLAMLVMLVLVLIIGAFVLARFA